MVRLTLLTLLTLSTLIRRFDRVCQYSKHHRCVYTYVDVLERDTQQQNCRWCRVDFFFWTTRTMRQRSVNTNVLVNVNHAIPTPAYNGRKCVFAGLCSIIGCRSCMLLIKANARCRVGCAPGAANGSFLCFRDKRVF